MRKKLRPFPERDDMRVHKGFLWIPKIIDGEIRWLEHAVWERQYLADRYCAKWRSTRWIDKDEVDVTADGVKVSVGDTVWYWNFDGGLDEEGQCVDCSEVFSAKVGLDEDEEGLSVCLGHNGYRDPWKEDVEYRPLDKCYSTREAALAAREGGE